MAPDLFWAAIGLVLLVVAGNALVKGAVNLALRLGIPALIVGLTVVAFGTSAPELLVSVQAVLKDQDGIALGNVVGSNIANALLVIGIPAMISVIHASHLDVRRSYLVMLAGTVLFIVICLLGPLTWLHALVLLAGLGAMLWDSYRQGRAHPDTVEEAPEGADPAMPAWRIGAWLAAGLVGLPLGANLLVESAVSIAREIGVSETVIGLTLVAVGTSLPELATSIIAALKRQADVALGNVIGSNVFNLLAIIGISGFVAPLTVPVELLRFDLWAMLAASLLLAPFVLGRKDIGRLAGLGLTAVYAGYLWFVIS